MTNEEQGLAISIALILAGNVIKLKSKELGDFVQGLGIGSTIGTVGHQAYKFIDDGSPHHDVIAAGGLSALVILDKTKIITNKALKNNLYGAGIGAFAQHVLTEGCSFCTTNYCENGEILC